MTQISHFHHPTPAEQHGGAPANSLGTARRHGHPPALVDRAAPEPFVFTRGKCNQPEACALLQTDLSITILGVGVPGGKLWNLYGPTETTIWSTVQRVESGEGSVPIGYRSPILRCTFWMKMANPRHPESPVTCTSAAQAPPRLLEKTGVDGRTVFPS